MSGDILTELRAALWRADSEHADLLHRAASQVARIHEFVADFFEWADHAATCALEDGHECDCGYDDLWREWQAIRG